MDDETTLGLTVAVIGAAASMFGRALPPIHEVRERPPTGEMVRAVRTQCARSGAVVLTLGAGVSIVTRSWYPILGVAGVCVWLWFEYETAAQAGAGSAPAAPAPAPRGRYT